MLSPYGQNGTWVWLSSLKLELGSKREDATRRFVKKSDFGSPDSRSNDNERLSRTLRVPLLFREPKRLRPAFCQKQDTSFGTLKSCHSLMPPLLLESVLFIRLRLDNRNHSQNQSNIRGFPLSTYAERGRGCPGCRPKCVHNKGGCVNLVLCISPKCVQFGGFIDASF